MRLIRSGRARGIAVVLAVLVVMMVADLALARVGGGQRYGGGSSGGGGGGGDGFGIIFYYLIQLAFRYPVVGVPLLIVAVFLFVKFGKHARSAQTGHTIQRAQRMSREQSAQQRQRNLEQLQQRDPGFQEQAFVERMNTAFLKLQEHYSKQDLTDVEALLSDGVRERFRLQLEMDRSEGIRNALESPRILSSRIVSVGSDRHFDTIHVEFKATGTDVDYDLKTGKKVRTNTSSPFTEYWSFMRKPGAQTLQKPGLVEGFCPNCGMHLEMTDTGKCGACDSVITSGEYDWVLTEITQEMEWQAISDPARIPGYSKMVQLDPGFSVQHIEDRTSVIFWRLMSAHFHNDPDAMRKVLHPDFMAEYAPRLRKQQDGSWVYFREAAIGAVEIQAIRPAEQDDGVDTVEVLVKWSARNAYRDGEGRSRGAGDKSIRPQLYVLGRKHGVTTPAGQSFRSAHCPGCGAPFEGGGTGSCDYCGRPLNDGSQDWVLMDVQSFSASRISAEAGGGIGRPATVPSEVLLAGMAAAMFIDGNVDEKEEKMLRDFAAARQISDETLEGILASVRSGENLPIPSTPQEAREILAAMARVILADGKVTRAENSMLVAYGAAKGMTPADVGLILNQQKVLLYREAKAAIKSMKGA
ncbi:TIM44-like domain-containing protein [Candidatus Fermentibacterales bacterium]|nr:TIM44-like domain-containing protein [Candidatus Fermentibacterales bacterium]